MPLVRQVSMSLSARAMCTRSASFMRFLVVENNERAQSAAIAQGWWAPEAYVNGSLALHQ